jgi:hypothetical protein
MKVSDSTGGWLQHKTSIERPLGTKASVGEAMDVQSNNLAAALRAMVGVRGWTADLTAWLRVVLWRARALAR